MGVHAEDVNWDLRVPGTKVRFQLARQMRIMTLALIFDETN